MLSDLKEPAITEAYEAKIFMRAPKLISQVFTSNISGYNNQTHLSTFKE